MQDPMEQGLANLAEISMSIMKKAVNTGELSETDILFLTMYQKEKRRACAVPTYKKVIGGVRDIMGAFKSLLPSDTADSVEVDTDAI